MKKTNWLYMLYRELRAVGISRAKILRLIWRILRTAPPEFPIFLATGLPAVGKGTVLEAYQKLQGAISVESFSKILRTYAKSEAVFAQQVKDAMDNGKRVPDDIVLEVLMDAIQNASSSFILDGVPRTMAQAIVLLLAGVNIKVLWFVCPENVVISRAKNRRICSNCNHVTSVPKAPDGICPKCGQSGTLHIRNDDAHIEKRCADFNAAGCPAVNFLLDNNCDARIISTEDTVPEDNAQMLMSFVNSMIMNGI